MMDDVLDFVQRRGSVVQELADLENDFRRLQPPRLSEPNGPPLPSRQQAAQDWPSRDLGPENRVRTPVGQIQGDPPAIRSESKFLMAERLLRDARQLKRLRPNEPSVDTLVNQMRRMAVELLNSTP